MALSLRGPFKKIQIGMIGMPKRGLPAVLTKVLATGVNALIISVLAPFFGLLIVEVLARKLAGRSLYGVYEITGFLMCWISMFGAYMAYRDKEFVRLSFLAEKFSPGTQRMINGIRAIIVLMILLFLGFSGLRFSMSQAVQSQVSTAFHIPAVFSYVAIPLACFLMALHVFSNCLDPQVPQEEEEMVSDERQLTDDPVKY